ncbi:MAG TPA: glycerol-3-phosphate 1-O-acyltransferase PlsY [Micropepsaceae bacterium]|jgi:glycerol-3-phosphate acyltransferase PlsY|nr:glycerol-3-phosphate 1-O-acyltransferase PlsY [Micropepsaceae bacterium]
MIERLALLSWQSAWPYLLAVFVLSYLLGSISFGLIFAKLAGAGDIRRIGSGNIGATNVLRTGKRWAAAATLICDGAKGYLAVSISGNLGGQAFAVIAGLGVFLGHLYPVWLGFKGGKGVATYIGIVLSLSPFIGLLVCAAWIAFAQAFRYSSLAALMSAVLAPVGFLFFDGTLFALLTFVLVVFIFYSHRANIVRLFKGEEPRIGAH